MSKSQSDRKRKLTEDELLYYLENDASSEVEFLSDSDEEDFQYENTPRRQTTDFLDEIVETNDEDHDVDELSDDEETELLDEETVNDASSSDDKEQLKKDIQSFEETHGLTDKSKIEWIRGENIKYQARNIQWNSPMLTNPVHLPAPIDFFAKYIPDELLQQMADMTNLYATQKNIARFPRTNLDEIRTFIGIHIIMGNLNFPRVSMYWHHSMGMPLVKDAMSLSRFYKLRQALHLVDITSREDNNNDR